MVLLYMLLVQLSLSLDHTPSHDRPSLLTAALQWLKWDVTFEQLRSFFPRAVTEAIQPVVSSLVPLQLSVVLDAFHQHTNKFDSLALANSALSKQADLVAEVVKRNDSLEEALQVLVVGGVSDSKAVT